MNTIVHDRIQDTPSLRLYLCVYRSGHQEWVHLKTGVLCTSVNRFKPFSKPTKLVTPPK